MEHYEQRLKEIEFYKQKWEEIEANMKAMEADELVDELIDAYLIYCEYYRRDDSICWSSEAEIYTRNIYCIIRDEIIRRLEM